MAATRWPSSPSGRLFENTAKLVTLPPERCHSRGVVTCGREYLPRRATATICHHSRRRRQPEAVRKGEEERAVGSEDHSTQRPSLLSDSVADVDGDGGGNGVPRHSAGSSMDQAMGSGSAVDGGAARQPITVHTTVSSDVDRALKGAAEGGTSRARNSSSVWQVPTEWRVSRGEGVKRVLLSFAAAAEFATQGFMLWTPAVFVVSLGISKLLSNSLEKQQRKATPPQPYQGQLVSYTDGLHGDDGPRFRRTADLMATMADSPVWMPVFMDNWWRVIERITSQNMIATLQEVLDAEAPAFLPMQAKWFFLGSTSPKCTNLQAFYRPDDQGLELFEMDFCLDSSDLLVLISGKLPIVGKLLVIINDFEVKGRLQFWTLPEEQLVLVDFERRPELRLGMTIKVWKRTLPGIRLICASLEQLCYETVEELMEGRRRTLLPVESRKPEEERIPVCGDIDIRVLGCADLPCPSGRHEYQVTARNSKLELLRKSMVKASDCGAPAWKNQGYTLRTGDSVGLFYLDVDDLTTGRRVGSAVVFAAALEHGCTAFWATGRDGRPLAKRWDPAGRPWTVTVPLENLETREVVPAGEITLQLSAQRWMYKQPKAPGTSSFSSAGPRSIILRIVEAHNVGDPSKPGTRFVQAKYNNCTYETQLVPNSPHLVWNRTFVFNENQSRQARNIRIRVLSAGSVLGLTSDLGFTYINLDSLYEGDPLDSRIELGGARTTTGRLHIVAQIVPGRADSPQVQRVAARRWEERSKPSLRVEVVRVRGLPSDLRGRPDPYVVLRYGGASAQTPYISRSVDAVFEHRVALPLCSPATNLDLLCYDYNALRRDGLMGRASVAVGALVGGEGQESSVWVALSNGKKQIGEVLLRMSRVGSFADADVAADETEEP